MNYGENNETGIGLVNNIYSVISRTISLSLWSRACFSNLMLVVVETRVAVFTTTAKKILTMGIVQQSVLVKYLKFPFKPEREMLQHIFKVKNKILVIQFCLTGLS